MKDGIKEILGKTITGVVVKARDDAPRSQVFLLFSDNTHFELYCQDADIQGTGGLWRGGVEDVRKYMSATARIVLEAYEA